MSDKPSLAQHYYLVAGLVTFVRKDETQPEQITLNTSITTPRQLVTAKSIGRGQQGLQMIAFERFGHEIQIVDVCVLSLSYLGRMTQEDFMAGVGELQNG